jgi:hypothetical protein
MSQQIQITGGAKVRNLEGVLTGTAGVVNALGINVPSGIPQLDGSGKILVSQLPNSVMEYKGTWNAATNTPTLADGTGNQGDVYLCNVAGTANFGSGPIAFAVGDQAIYSGTIWQKAGGSTGTVTSVAVTETGDALTITGSPITTSGTINIGFAGTSGQYVNGAGGLTTFPSLTGFVPYTGATANVDLGTFDLTADVITGATGSFASSGGSNTFAINHSSGSGIALNITKGGNGEGLVINKTSGSGNALSVTGSTSLGALSGTSATFSSDILVSGVRVGIGSGGTNNTRVGPLSFMSNTTGSFNTAIGTYTLNANTTGSGNTALGNIALIVNTTGQNNTAIGAGTLGNITTGSNNTGLGIEAGISITTGSNNTIIGNYAGTAAMSNNIVLADGAGNIRYQWNGTNNVFGNPISGTSATFSSNTGLLVGASSRAFIRQTSGGDAEIGAASGGLLSIFNNGSSALSFAAGGAATFSSSAAINAIFNSTDANGGYLAFRRSGTDIGYLGNSAQLGIGVLNALEMRASNDLILSTTSGLLRITSGGNVGINLINPATFLHVFGSNTSARGQLCIQSNNTSNAAKATWYYDTFNSGEIGTTSADFYGASTNNFLFLAGGAERMRITSGGSLKVTSTSSFSSYGAATHMISNTGASYTWNVENQASSGNMYGQFTYWPNASPNNSTSQFLNCYDSVNTRLIIYANGGIANYQANNVNLSDERTKKDIIPLGSYWDKFKAIEIVKFKYKDQTHDDYNIGVIAQQVEKVAPEFVDIDGWDNKHKLDEYGNMIVSNKEPLKSIYTADLHHATIKVLQEAMAKIELLEQKVKELQNK